MLDDRADWREAWALFLAAIFFTLSKFFNMVAVHLLRAEAAVVGTIRKR
jgi:hypothetical protein